MKNFRGGSAKMIFGKLSSNQPAPDNTLFIVASQTKPVTALLCMKLEKTGKLDLDDPVFHYWIDPDIAGNPYLKNYGEKYTKSSKRLSKLA